MADDTDRKGRFLITGASNGIGEDLARVCAANGHDLVLVARSETKLSMLVGQLSEAHSIRADVVSMDLTASDAPKLLYDAIIELGLEVDWLVNNAGFGAFGEFAELGIEKQAEMIRLNVTSLTELTWYFLRPMIERGRGGILNVASTAAFQPGPLMAVYYATKAYVLSFGEALANEVADSGVTVSTLCPGPTETGFQRVAGMGESLLLKSAFVMASAKVAEAGYRGLMKGERVIVPGLMNKIGAFGTRLIPRSVAATIARKAQE